MDLSTRLSYLFGTEEYVSKRRQLVLLRENVINHEARGLNVNFICSGSLGEGVAYPKSDDDMMMSLNNCRVVLTYREASLARDVLMVPSECSSGYCRLLDVKGSYSDHFIHSIDGMLFVSSLLWKQCFAGEGQYIHGPCLSGTIGYIEFDFALCFHCHSWPDIANNWVMRNRLYEWPSCEMIQNIIHNGCHVVPIGDPDSPNGDHEWRISFSVAERILMHSFNHAQFLVYNLLRLTLKRVIEKTFPGVLCSYFMKTTLFYTSENTSMELWRLENLETYFRACLSVLYDYVDHVYCPNYFIPEYNMIKRKINQTNRHQMLDLLRTVYAIGIVGILNLSGELSCLHDRLSASIMEYKLHREFICSGDHLRKVLLDMEILFFMIPHGNIEWCAFNLYELWGLLKCNYDNPSIIPSDELRYIIWNEGINLYCLKIMDFILSSSKMNTSKHNYRIIRILEALLRIGFRTNVTTGKLTMATYMYMVGKTSSALFVIRQLLSEYPPYVIDVFADGLKAQAYIDVMCGRGFTMNYKVQHAYAPGYSLRRNCLNAFPSPLKMWITIMDRINLDPLTCAYVLENLCHFQNQKKISFMKSLRCLVNHMGSLKLTSDIVDTRMCVGIIKCVQGDNQSACRWLGSVYFLWDTAPPPFNDALSRSALTYIACLLNKKFKSVQSILQNNLNMF
ncbi:hypothetical protein FSP39_021848 [Pinctada imbricata]|uniref:Uncharacterized protein n=1 Tax=Pinctada imbricata TaxID=66713 RepID=A0AA88XNI1_PINIB|nr:hypothetical protein FSP39_021848 [Pinctada imbricata]